MNTKCEICKFVARNETRGFGMTCRWSHTTDQTVEAKKKYAIFIKGITDRRDANRAARKGAPPSPDFMTGMPHKESIQEKERLLLQKTNGSAVDVIPQALKTDTESSVKSARYAPLKLHMTRHLHQLKYHHTWSHLPVHPHPRQSPLPQLTCNFLNASFHANGFLYTTIRLKRNCSAKCTQ